MAVESNLSSYVTPLQSLPMSALTSGEGAPGTVRYLSDMFTFSTTGNSVGTTYRVCRFPTYAKVKSLIIDLGGIDTNATATATFEVNVAFSNSAYDGTQQALQGLIPTTALDMTTTTAAAYSSPNKLFGSLTAANSGAKKMSNQMLFNGTAVASWFTAGGNNIPMWKFFNYTTSLGYDQDPGGYFDILLYLSAVSATAAAAPVHVKLEYVV